MKPKYNLRSTTVLALLVGLSPALSAQPRSQAGNPSTADRPQQSDSTMTTGNSADTSGDYSRGSQQSRQRQSSDSALRRQSAHELTGIDVQNRNGDKLGRVKDFVIDANSGQVVYAVIGSGGVVGIGESLHAVPVSALNYDNSGGNEHLTLDISSDRWNQAPRFRKDRLSSLQQDQEGKDTFQYYGQTWRDSSQSLSMNNPARNQGSQQQQQQRQGSQLVMSSDIIGQHITSGGKDVGEIDDVLVQFQNRTAALLVDPDNDYVGSDQKYVVPFNKLTVLADNKITTSLTRNDFASAQVAPRDAWSSAPSGYVNSLYVWPNNDTFGSTFSDRVSQRTRDDTASDDATRWNQPGQPGQQDQQGRQGQPPVAEIRRAIQGDSSLAKQGGDDVRVISQGDKVVLLGTVQTKEAKDKIEDRAEKAAPGWSIQNQIRVAGVDE